MTSAIRRSWRTLMAVPAVATAVMTTTVNIVATGSQPANSVGFAAMAMAASRLTAP